MEVGLGFFLLSERRGERYVCIDPKPLSQPATGKGVQIWAVLLGRVDPDVEPFCGRFFL